ncbi:MAG: glycosyltransferase family 2 protein [Cyanobacteriota bacterium]
MSQKDKYDLCVIIPAFNEELCLEDFIYQLKDTLNLINIDYVISIVDDGSRDSTWDQIIKLKNTFPEKIMGFRFSRNFGKDAAIMASLENIYANAYLIMDADGQHPVERIQDFVNMWKNKDFEIINGVKEYGKNVHFLRIFFSKAFNKLFEKLSGLKLERSTDFKLITRKVAAEIIKCGDYYIFFRALATWVGFKQTNIEFMVKERQKGYGKWPTKTLINYALNAIVFYSYFPMYLLFSLAVCIFILSIYLFVKMIIYYFLGNVETGYSTLLALMLMSLSTNLFCFGIIGLYLQKILDQVKFRPRYILTDSV